MNSDRVIIVGAGPVGLTAGMLLAEKDIPVLILEAGSVISDDLRASTFHPQTLDMLEPYGLTDELIAQGLICPTWQIRMHATGEKAVFDLSLISDETVHPYRLQCEQAKLCRLLADRFSDDDRIDIQYSTKVTGISQTDETVEVLTERVDGGAEETLTARYVIGADGAGSVVRESLGLKFKGSTYPETTVLASTTFPFQDYIDGLSNVSYCWSEGGNFALLRLKDFWRCSFYYDPDLTFEEATSDEERPARHSAQTARILQCAVRGALLCTSRGGTGRTRRSSPPASCTSGSSSHSRIAAHTLAVTAPSPPSRAALALLATRSDDSPWYWRRSECPTMAH